MLSGLSLTPSIISGSLLMSLPSPLSEDHFLHSKSTQENMATDYTSTVHVKSQTALESLGLKAQIRTLIVQAWITCPSLGQLIVIREQDYIVGKY